MLQYFAGRLTYKSTRYSELIIKAQARRAGRQTYQIRVSPNNFVFQSEGVPRRSPDRF